MNTVRIARLVRFSLAFLGAGMAIIAVFAYPLGLDNNRELGSSRAALLAAGLFLVWLAVGPVLGWMLRRLWTAAMTRIGHHPFAPATSRSGAEAPRDQAAAGRNEAVLGGEEGRGAESPSTRPERRLRLGKNATTASFLICLFAVAVLFAWWLGTAGTWSEWPASTDYYASLADSFRAGKLYLLEQPDSRILALPDPYEFEAREGVDYPWDVSLYGGRYYLYWGPTPALVLALIQPLLGARVADEKLVFVSAIGILLLSMFLLGQLKRRLAPDLPVWTIVPPGIALALSAPTFFLLDRPRVYEAAIAAGQAFFLVGVALLLSVDLEGRASRPRLFLAGGFFAFAVAARPTLVFGIFVMLAYAVAMLVRNAPRRSQPFPWSELLSLLAPVAAASLALGVYNAARFDNPLEFGHRYQLTGWNLHRQYGDVFSPAHAPLNLYNYLLNPFKTLEVFPFVKPRWGVLGIGPISASRGYYTEQVSGILRTTPFVLLAFAPIVLWAQRWLNQDILPAPTLAVSPRASLPRGLARLYAVWGVTAVALLLPTLIFYFATMRYLADFAYSLLFLACLGYWVAYIRTRPKSPGRFTLGALALSLALLSAGIGLLLAVTGYTARFEHVNPLLYEAITRFFAW